MFPQFQILEEEEEEIEAWRKPQRSDPDDSLQNCQPPLVKVCMIKIWSRLTKVISGTPEICFLSNFFF